MITDPISHAAAERMARKILSDDKDPAERSKAISDLKDSILDSWGFRGFLEVVRGAGRGEE